ncbi:MBL fold metallo-hydrolase [Magnetospira sp. QH-2]|uniref:MBL fold metallo-hydrolase n=1 Tax=Magnetospira sp. (strain QH-2) TaxID=1288970 RepID=UPI0003E80B6C|nr:MBL fold metallo-hydrolase [Magnetospira sp. QH-2]CCQ74557.1 Putative cyclase (modular protein) [Magnetospira sp. QH-2]
MVKSFASRDDRTESPVTFEPVAEGVYVHAAEGDPNCGVVIGRDAVLVVDVLATRTKVAALHDRIAQVTDLPVKYLALTHHHAVRVRGASALGSPEIITSHGTRDLLVERGETDYQSEKERFPRLFAGADEEGQSGPVHPTLIFDLELIVDLGDLEVHLLHPGRGHTAGDLVAWIPERGVLFAGDLVGFRASPYVGDGYMREWSDTLEVLEALSPEILVPGRGPVAKTPTDVDDALGGTDRYLVNLWDTVREGVARGEDLRTVYTAVGEHLRPSFGDWRIFDHCLPFNVSRAYEEALGIRDPRPWTHERDVDLWRELEGIRTVHPEAPELPLAIQAIRAEHLSFHTVTHLFGELVNDLRAGRISFDAELYRLILDYMDNFLGVYHHPKEEECLFAPLRAKVPASVERLDLLIRHHRQEETIRNQMKEALTAVKPDDDASLAWFCDLADSHLNLGRVHTRMEESEILPLALEKLSAGDWVEIDKAFDDRESPIYGEAQKERYKALLHRITYLAPEPHGLGGGG